MKIKKVLVVINPVKAGAKEMRISLKRILGHYGIQISWMEALHYRPGILQKMHDLKECRADLALVCGGDGTLIQTAHRLRGSGVPILGINIGYLGFITTVDGRRMKKSIERILKGDYQIQERLALDVTAHLGKRKVKGWALNDVLLTRGENPHVISVRGWVDRHPINHYRCDGLIVATPTGSTAYSLAAGGPIISPECDVVGITPICPQALTNRSVVVNCSRGIEMSLDPSSGNGEIQVDGMTLVKVKPEQKIEVISSKCRVPIAFLPEIDFFDSVAEKLQWHGSGVSTPKYNRR